MKINPIKGCSLGICPFAGVYAGNGAGINTVGNAFTVTKDNLSSSEREISVSVSSGVEDLFTEDGIEFTDGTWSWGP